MRVGSSMTSCSSRRVWGSATRRAPDSSGSLDATGGVLRPFSRNGRPAGADWPSGLNATRSKSPSRWLTVTSVTAPAIGGTGTVKVSISAAVPSTPRKRSPSASDACG